MAVITDDTPRGYSDIIATDEYFIGLYSGFTDTDGDIGGWFADKLFFFDREGGFQYGLRLDRRVWAIALDAISMRLYASTEHPEPAILAFDLTSPDAGGAGD